MNQQRSQVPMWAMVLCLGWAAMAWLGPAELAATCPPSVLWHRIASVAMATLLAIHLFLAVTFEPTE